MARFVKGDVVVIPFPYSDLSKAKKRPALVISPLDSNEVILCQITSQWSKGKYIIPINEKDFTQGTLKKLSHIKFNRIFTADRKIILYRVGRISKEKLEEVINGIIKIVKQ